MGKRRAGRADRAPTRRNDCEGDLASRALMHGARTDGRTKAGGAADADHGLAEKGSFVSEVGGRDGGPAVR